MEAKEMERKIEDLRARLNEAVAQKNGDLQASEVYEISSQLDMLITQFMCLKKTGS